MRKLILLLIAGMFLVNLGILVYAENCQLAVPSYGVVQCNDIGDEEHTLNLQNREDDSMATYTCPTSCELKNLPSNINCGLGYLGYHWTVKVGDDTVYLKPSWGTIQGNLPAAFGRGKTLNVIGYCRSLIGTMEPIKVTSINLNQKKWMLQEGWGGTLPTSPIQGTENCILNKLSEDYKDDRKISYLDPSTGSQQTSPASTYSYNTIPTNWNLGDKYIFIKYWVTNIAGISLTYDKNNNAYWCGGEYGSRKIYNVQEVTSATGQCYAIPQSVSIPNAECCVPSDCIDKYSAQYTCNPENWKCEKTKPCNSQIECDQTFGEGICQNKQISKWACDTNKKWGSYAGTCINSVRNVEQCSSDCTTEEYYNEEEGKCKPRNVLLNCPTGKCCVGGGSYKEKACESGLECCRSDGSYSGECKADCSKTEVDNIPPDKKGGMPQPAVIGGGSGWGIGIAIFFVVLIGSSIGIYFYTRKSKSSSMPVKKGVYCTKCGSSLNDGFCIKCGKKG